ncbi:MAG: Cellulose 1,4-beta-cellobiosidase [Herbinix sp.]|nr:Cellulose 1,4-beta-cellobiosidase [Herbinix sp.]
MMKRAVKFTFKRWTKNLITSMMILALFSTTLTSLMFPKATDLPKAASAATTDAYQNRFMELWGEIHDSSNGYFSPQGIPYHSIETMIVEAPDYGHVTTSEAFSYYMWLEAMYGKFTGDFSSFQTAWNATETYIIPTAQDQPNTSMAQYNASKPATYAPEGELPSMYPAQLNSSAAVGNDPIHNDLVSTYGNSMIYGMHWLLDVDNWYGFGRRADGTSKPSYINTFQRGKQESTWETIPQPCWDAKTFGGTNGYLDLFVGDSSYATQFKYTNAPDADARAVQATYWANEWADELGIERLVLQVRQEPDTIQHIILCPGIMLGVVALVPIGPGRLAAATITLDIKILWQLGSYPRIQNLNLYHKMVQLTGLPA